MITSSACFVDKQHMDSHKVTSCCICLSSSTQCWGPLLPGVLLWILIIRAVIHVLKPVQICHVWHFWRAARPKSSTRCHPDRITTPVGNELFANAALTQFFNAGGILASAKLQEAVYHVVCWKMVCLSLWTELSKIFKGKLKSFNTDKIRDICFVPGPYYRFISYKLCTLIIMFAATTQNSTFH